MLTVVVLAAAIVLGAHPAAIGLAALAVVEPRLVLFGAAIWGVYHLTQRRRGSGADTEAAFLRALAAELRGGTTLRVALADAADRVPLGLERAGRLARAGAPMDRIAPLLSERLAHNGVAAAAAFEMSAWSGARTAAVFEGLAERANEAAELEREQRVATTQARLSAWVVGLAPLVFTAAVLAGGGWAGLQRAGSTGFIIVGIGLSLELAGLAVVALILRRASS
jgi:Flp pilus assembly protein TadB